MKHRNQNLTCEVQQDSKMGMVKIPQLTTWLMVILSESANWEYLGSQQYSRSLISIESRSHNKYGGIMSYPPSVMLRGVQGKAVLSTWMRQV